MHLPIKIPTVIKVTELLIKDLFTQHSQIHSYKTRHKLDLHATHFNIKNYRYEEISYIYLPDKIGIPCQMYIKGQKSLTIFRSTVKKSY